MKNKYIGNYGKQIETFQFEIDNSVYTSYYINKSKNKNENIISILVNPESKIKFNSYSTQLNLNEIQNKNGKHLNLLKYFVEDRVFIIKVSDSELIFGILTDEIYTNLLLQKFDKEKFIYKISLKKNDYYVVWRDPHFAKELHNKYTEYLDERKLFCIEKANMNIYSLTSTEKALKFILNRKEENDKIIFITNIGKDKSGKRFIEIVRKIYNFDIIVLFYSKNFEHFKWIKDLPNCLYTNKTDIYEKYLTNYNEAGLLDLKKEVEENYKIKLKDFSENFINIPFNNKIFKEPINPYLRHVSIFNKNQNKYLCMNKEKKVIIAKDFNDDCLWDVTILDKTITLYSNNFYLNENKENENAEGYENMVVWNFIEDRTNDEIKYSFINLNKGKNNILSIKGEEVKINEFYLIYHIKYVI